MYSVGCHGNILIISDGSILHVWWKGSIPLVSVIIKNTSRTSPRQPSSFVTLLGRPVSDNDSQHHGVTRTIETGVAISPGSLHYVTSTCNYSNVLVSCGHITSTMWSTSRPRHQSPRLAYLFPACDSWFHITPVPSRPVRRPRSYLMVPFSHFCNALNTRTGQAQDCSGLSPDWPW